MNIILWLLVLWFFSSSKLFAAEATSKWKADWAASLNAAEQEARLVIYGPRGHHQQTLYTDVFRKTFPKIRVNYTGGRMSEIISRIMAEQRAGVRQLDLVLGGTDILLSTLKDGGLLQSVRQLLILPEVLDTSGWFQKKLWFADTENQYIPMWRAMPYLSACVNTNLVKPGEIKSYWDLLNPKWKGKISSQDLSIGSARNQMYAVYVRQDLGEKYLRRLFGEMDITFSRNLTQLGDWLAAGKFAIGLGGVDCVELDGKGLPVKPVFLEGLGAVGAGTDPAALLKTAPHPNAAKVFLNWILTPEGQTAFQEMTKENSLRIDIPKDGLHPAYVLDPKREYLFTGLEEHKDKINAFRPWLESLAKK
jgi:iron(III) transport system substrate-binding protein